MKKIFLIACAFVLFLPVFVSADTDHLVISQVQITGANTTDDFIEIYNPTSSDINLKDYRLVKRAKTSTSDTSIKAWSSADVIKAHGFYLWAYTDYTSIAVTPDSTTKPSGGLADNNGIALRNGALNTGSIIDSMGWGEAANGFVEGSAFANFTSSHNPNQSLERLPGAELGNGTDTNNNSADFILQTAAHPRNSQSPAMPPIVSEPPPPAPTPAPPVVEEPTGPKYSQEIVISEFLPNPDGADSGKEWVEFYNNSPDEVDISDWILDGEATVNLIGKSAYTFPSGSKIAAQSFWAFNLPEGSFLLNNTGGDTLRLLWPNKTLLTQATYTQNARDDETYARKIEATYAWTNLATKGTANQFPGATDGIVSAAETRIKFTEIFPGGWVELINTGTEPILIHNWTVDGGKPGSAINPSAWKIQSPTLDAGGLAVLTILADTFALDNLSGRVRLFNENGILIDTVSYSDAKEGMSYQLLGSQWAWAKPTPNATNILLAEETIPQPVSQPAPAKENQIILAVDEKPVNTHAALSQPVPIVETEVQTSPAGVVSGSVVADQTSLPKSAAVANNKLFWVWLALSFALNLAFCYILVKLMLRNKGI